MRVATVFANMSMVIDTILLPLIGCALAVFFVTLWQAPRDNYNSIEAKYVCQCNYNFDGYRGQELCHCPDYAEGSSNNYPLIKGIFAWSFAFLPDIFMGMYMIAAGFLIACYLIIYTVGFIIYSVYLACSQMCCGESTDPELRRRQRKATIGTFDRKFQYLICCSTYRMTKAHQSFVNAGGVGKQCCEDFWSCSFLDYLLVCCNGNRLVYGVWIIVRAICIVVCCVWLSLYPTLDCSCAEHSGENGEVYKGKRNYNDTWEDLLPLAQSYAGAYVTFASMFIVFRFITVFIVRRVPVSADTRTWAFTYLAIPLKQDAVLQL
jgi:hypothetical protein